MKVRYQADADLRIAIVRGVLRREPLADFRSAEAAQLDRRKDVLALAEAEVFSCRTIVVLCRTTSGYLAGTSSVREYFRFVKTCQLVKRLRVSA